MKGDSPLKSAVRLLPAVFMTVLGSVAGGFILSKVGRYSLFYIIGTGLGVIGSAVLFTTTVDTSDAVIYVFTAVMGLGAGLSSQVAFSVAQAKVRKEQVGQAIAFLSTGQILSVLLSIAISGTVMLNTAISGLEKLLTNVSPDVIKNDVAGTAGNALESLSPQVREQALSVLVDAINKVWIITLSAACLGFACSLLLKHERIFIAGH